MQACMHAGMKAGRHEGRKAGRQTGRQEQSLGERVPTHRGQSCLWICSPPRAAAARRRRQSVSIQLNETASHIHLNPPRSFHIGCVGGGGVSPGLSPNLTPVRPRPPRFPERTPAGAHPHLEKSREVESGRGGAHRAAAGEGAGAQGREAGEGGEHRGGDVRECWPASDVESHELVDPWMGKEPMERGTAHSAHGAPSLRENRFTNVLLLPVPRRKKTVRASPSRCLVPLSENPRNGGGSAKSRGR